jgi:hypothetical protein
MLDYQINLNESTEKMMAPLTGYNPPYAQATNVNEEIEVLNHYLRTRYQIIEKIGKGGMGAVYLATDIKLRRSVAIKTLFFDKLNSRYINRFNLEAIVTANLQHPHIVQVYEIIDIENVPVYVMEYVKGEPLHVYARQKGRRLDDIIALFIPICKGIGYAHSQGFVHRDIKPSNILITDSGHPKILDFGLAKRLASYENSDSLHFKIEEDDLVIGSPSYMSPEQIKGLWNNIDKRTDIYSLGVTLYSTLTQRTPFQSKNHIDLVDQILNQEPFPPTLLKPDMPQDLEGICLKAMSKKPENRYQSTDELIEDIQNYLKGDPVSAIDYSFKQKTLRSINRKKELVLLATILVWAMFAGILFLMNNFHTISTESLTSELRANLKGLAAATATTIDGDTIETIRTDEDIQRPEVKKIIRSLQNVKLYNEEIESIWIMRRSSQNQESAEFVLDDNSLDNLAQDAATQEDHNNIKRSLTFKVGQLYENTYASPELMEGFLNPIADKSIKLTKKMGVNFSAYAPVKNMAGETVAIVGVDMKFDDIMATYNEINRSFYLTIIVSLLMALLLNGFIFIWTIGRTRSKVCPKSS